MGLLYELAQKYRTLSIVGMAKNAGKTTALNYLIEEAYDEEINLGITSTGRDGESQDLVTGTEKPKVFLYEDAIVTVPSQLYDLADAGLEILSMSKYRTSMGELLLCKVASSGYVQIAGPVATADTKKTCNEMFDLGCELILIDGAIDRKSIASPDSSDAIILSTGAVLSRSMDKVVSETAHIIELYTLPELENGKAKDLIVENMEQNRVSLVKAGKLEVLDLTTGLGASRYIDEAIDEDTDYVYVPGALTESVICDIQPQNLKRTTLVLKDPTKIFLGSTLWKQLKKKGLKVKVIQNIKIAAITVNPYSPAGYSFDNKALVAAMEEAAGDIPVVDVKM